MIIDTSALLAYFDTDEPDHQAVAAVLDDTDEPLVVSPYVVAELDYLVGSRLGVAAELAVLAELAGGAWDLPAIDGEGLKDLARSSNGTTSGSASPTPRTSSSPRATGRRRSSPSTTVTSTSFVRWPAAASRSCRSAEPRMRERSRVQAQAVMPSARPSRARREPRASRPSDP